MNKKFKIAAVEDEADILELLKLNITQGGYEFEGFTNASELFKHFENNTFDLLLLDIMLPDMDGIEICKKLREDPLYKQLPIIMLTARGSELDRILGLEIGADDYVTKPFSERELLARIKALLRRISYKKTNKDDHFEALGGGLKIDYQRYKVYYKNQEIPLTITEFKILTILAEQPGRVFERANILEKLWGADRFAIDRTIDVHISHLRKKLGKYGELIENVRGVGYRLTES